MTDETARIAAELARQMGTTDWVDVYESHTDLEWTCVEALYVVSPWGEKRADIRAAYHTANLMCTQPGREVDDAEFREIFRRLMAYMPCDKEQRPSLTDSQIEALEKIRQ